MLKWVWKLYQQENPLWAKIVRAKYSSADNIFSGSGRRGSQFWKSIHKIKHFFKLGAKHVINDGNRTLFWLDRWCDDEPLKDHFPQLFNICLSQMCSVAQVCGLFI
jgi:hypothetical protein